MSAIIVNSTGITANFNQDLIIQSSGNTANVIINGLKYPKVDGANGQALITDGSGNINFQNTSDVYSTKISLIPSQIANLNSIPISIISNPGIGKAISIENVSAKLDFNSISYDAIFLYVGPVSANTDTAQFINHDLFLYAGSSGHNFFDKYFFNGLAGSSEQIKENSPIYLYSSADDTSGGNSNIDLYIRYVIIDL